MAKWRVSGLRWEKCKNYYYAGNYIVDNDHFGNRKEYELLVVAAGGTQVEFVGRFGKASSCMQVAEMHQILNEGINKEWG